MPRYASPEDAAVARTSLTIHSLSFLERFWYIIAAAAVLLAGGAVALILVLKERNAKRVTGTLRVRCDALELNQMLTFFDDSKGVKVGAPITTHAELSKLKGKKAYALLSNVRMDNAMTAPSRERAGPEPDLHRPPDQAGNRALCGPLRRRTRDPCHSGRRTGLRIHVYRRVRRDPYMPNKYVG